MFKQWLKLRRQRNHALQVLEQMGLVVQNMHFCSCYRCREEMYALLGTYTLTSLMGESWTRRAPIPEAHACLRCQTVSLHADGSGDETHVDLWVAKRIQKLAQSSVK
jgi:hypothetical protein